MISHTSLSWRRARNRSYAKQLLILLHPFQYVKGSTHINTLKTEAGWGFTAMVSAVWANVH
jgi:hypothetical protein